MSILVEVAVRTADFRVGELLTREGATAELERSVPLGDRFVPAAWIRATDVDAFEETVGDSELVTRLERTDDVDGWTRYRLDWDAFDDDFFDGVVRADGEVVRGRGDCDEWWFRFRFPDYGELSAFQEEWFDANIEFELVKIRLSEDTDGGRGKLTEAQWTALSMAVDRGYYDIPRHCSTLELADELGISDQAVTERLRRGIATLVANARREEGDEPPPSLNG